MIGARGKGPPLPPQEILGVERRLRAPQRTLLDIALGVRRKEPLVRAEEQDRFELPRQRLCIGGRTARNDRGSGLDLERDRARIRRSRPAPVDHRAATRAIPVSSATRFVTVTKGCRSICASPVPGVTASLTLSTIPPTTRLAAASARGPNVSPSVVPLSLVACCCSTAPDPSVPVPSTLSYSNTDQAQTACAGRRN